MRPCTNLSLVPWALVLNLAIVLIEEAFVRIGVGKLKAILG